MKKTLIAGVDEAGRGCVLGPLVIAICVVEKDKEDFLKKLGVKDSKLLTKLQREKLFPIIVENCEGYKIIQIPAEELNISMNSFSLNEIEAQKISEIIKDVKKFDKVILDSPDTDTNKFRLRVCRNLKVNCKDLDYEIVSEHKADFKYISVAAASILAKVTRDNLLFELLGNDLSGYSSDPKTIDYLKNYILENKTLPHLSRTKWKTIDNVMKELYQKKLGWFSAETKSNKN
ncbi:MAG: ribonuclease HII [archaeon]